jgi:hypothetical protein
LQYLGMSDPYLRFDAWRRLTDEGRRSPEQMSARERAELDALALTAEEIDDMQSPAPRR